MKKKGKQKIMVLLMGMAVLATPTPIHAESLTDLFRMRAFQGSMETISKLNWAGALMSGIISIFSFVGLCMLVFRIMTTIMYLSGRNVFDQIHDIKSSSKGAAFGLPELWKGVYQSNHGSGLDAFISLFLGLLPDVKMYSDYNDDRRNPQLDGDESITQYILKTAIPNVMMIFFLSIGFSGTLWQMFGTVVDAMTVAADKVANTNLTQNVNRLLNTDSYYKFGFGDDGTNWGKLKENMAKSIYNKVLSKSDSSIDGNTSLALGATIGEFFGDNGDLNAKGISYICVGEETLAADDMEGKNIEYSVVVNSVAGKSDKIKNSHEYVIPFKELYSGISGKKDTHAVTQSASDKATEKQNVSNTATDLYVHIYMYRKESAIKHNYFSVKSKNTATSETNTGNKPTGANLQSD